jgi:hypothetical protein
MTYVRLCLFVFIMEPVLREVRAKLEETVDSLNIGVEHERY